MVISLGFVIKSILIPFPGTSVLNANPDSVLLIVTTGVFPVVASFWPTYEAGASSSPMNVSLSPNPSELYNSRSYRLLCEMSREYYRLCRHYQQHQCL
jgi:hypothetical protein